MAIDPQVALAFSVQTNKGLYALLLGSGISRSAGIPTGWEVVLDLVGKLARIQNEEPDPTPETWFKLKYGEEAKYSSLLDALTHTASERNQLLRSYFEPNDEERNQGLKTPTAAHRAIAELMRLGYFRVVLTTNLDRLLEQALRDVGMEPTVISTPDATKGAPPLAHTRCVIIKLHGDYLDHRIKNTPAELARYEKPINTLLDRVLDEFGLIVCGWSAEYDIALRAAIERCPNRRFPMYWATRDRVAGVAEKLISLRAGTTLVIPGADEFFGTLRDNVSVLHGLQESDIVSQKVAVARIKKYLSSPEHLIDFHDLLHGETERVFAKIYGPQYPVQGVQFSPELLARRLAAYEESCSILLSMVACAAYWSAPEHHEHILKCLRRFVEDAQLPNGLNVLVDLRRYPALLFFYVACLSAIAGDKYALVAAIFSEPIRLGPYRETGQLISLFHVDSVISYDFQKLLPGRERQFTPLSTYLFEQLRASFREHLPSDLDYERTFDWFEYLVGLMHCYNNGDWPEYEKAKAEGKAEQYRVWGPLGCFAWRHRGEPEWILHETQGKDGKVNEKIAKARQAFFPGNDPSVFPRFLLAKEAFDRFVTRVVISWH